MALADLLPALPWLAPFATLFRLPDSRPNLSDVAPVVDDGSTDDTAAIVERLAAGEPRLRLARGAGLDIGWLERAALIATALSALFWALISYGMKIPMLYGIGYPVGALMALCIVGRSTWRGSRRVEWRGRVYRR